MLIGTAGCTSIWTAKAAFGPRGRLLGRGRSFEGSELISRLSRPALARVMPTKVLIEYVVKLNLHGNEQREIELEY